MSRALSVVLETKENKTKEKEGKEKLNNSERLRPRDTYLKLKTITIKNAGEQLFSHNNRKEQFKRKILIFLKFLPSISDDNLIKILLLFKKTILFQQMISYYVSYFHVSFASIRISRFRIF